MLSADPSLPGEMELLLACARISPHANDAAIRQYLARGIDFTVFANKAISHGLAGLAGHTLTSVAPDAIADDISNAFRVLIDDVRRNNGVLVTELSRVLDALARKDVEAIPIKGPVVALKAYGDLGLRQFRDLDFLIRDKDVRTTRAVLRDLGYAPPQAFSEPQLNVIHRIQGQEIMLHRSNGICLEPHTRLTPQKMALDIDYTGLWSRARKWDLAGHPVLTLSPEDELLMLAIHGGKEVWWRMNWVCDVAAYIQAHPQLDWDAIIERAKAQGCLRFILLATYLARRYFDAKIPDSVAGQERAYPALERIARRVAGFWLSEEQCGPPSNKTISKDRLWLHDGLPRRARYALRTCFLPSPHHISWFPLPEPLSFAYVPLKTVHDVFFLPSWRAYEAIAAQGERAQKILAPMFAWGEAGRALREHERARRVASKAVEENPANVAAWLRLAAALTGLKRPREALACYERALILAPENMRIRERRKELLREFPEAAASERYAAEPVDATGWRVRAGDLFFANRYAECIAACDRVLTLEPKNLGTLRLAVRARMKSCDWSREEEDRNSITEFLASGVNIVTPLYHRTMYDSEAEHLKVAKIEMRASPPSSTPLWRGEIYRHKKIRVAYVSSDLRKHATTNLIVGCLEAHDRSRFETTAISLFADDGTQMRKRIEAAFDHFITVKDMSDREVAQFMREQEIDIAVDLNGHTHGARPQIFALRPAPIQVNFLGFPGTVGATFIDYIIADPIVIPEENRVHYSERVAYLPHSYQPNDRNRTITERPLTRMDAALPERAFVFTCLNNPSKIRPHVFDVWMRLLAQVEGSVLWLLDDGPSTKRNLRREAKSRGVDPERLIFAPTVAPAEHLARQRLADLFLDTDPYNAHTTCSDALWVGLPVVTCMGKSFPARVAASLLHAAGLPELVTHSLDEYEKTALALARKPQRLAALKGKLANNRLTSPLFDTALFARHLEAAYTTMWERYEAGQGPASFSVPASGSSFSKEGSSDASDG